MYYMRAAALLAALGLTIFAAGCGGTGGLPGAPAIGARATNPTIKSDMEQTQYFASQPTRSPAPSPTFNPFKLPILHDTSNSTSGVFLGADCGVGASITCATFANTMRHDI